MLTYFIIVTSFMPKWDVFRVDFDMNKAVWKFQQDILDWRLDKLCNKWKLRTKIEASTNWEWDKIRLSPITFLLYQWVQVHVVIVIEFPALIRNESIFVLSVLSVSKRFQGNTLTSLLQP